MQKLLSSLLLITPLALPAAAPAAEAVRLANRGAGAPDLGLSAPGASHPLTGPRSRLERDWVGLRTVAPDTPILVMAGHADSQNIGGPGTSGEAVALRGARPMYTGISDELYWNMVVSQAVVELGRRRGLNIRYHRPPFRTIQDGDAPGTNWSVGREHVETGGYALEIHFDAYGPDGVGSGLIPPMRRPFSRIDESLAREFGGYPMHFRSVLGGPRRGIALLEIGKLEGRLEASLRDPSARGRSVTAIAERVVTALEQGLGRVSPRPGVVGSVPPGSRPPASPAAE
jgi:hypothetical protein